MAAVAAASSGVQRRPGASMTSAAPRSDRWQRALCLPAVALAALALGVALSSASKGVPDAVGATVATTRAAAAAAAVRETLVNVQGWQSLPVAQSLDEDQAFGPLSVAARGGIGEGNYFRTSLSGSSRRCRSSKPKGTFDDDDGKDTYVQAANVRVGDYVHVGGGTFEPVLAILPQSAPCASCLVKITTEDGKALVLSASHLMPLDGGQMPSTRMAVGDFVKSADGKNISHVAVASITPVHSQTKVRMPLTPSCRLDVNGVVVSCASTGTAPPNLLAALLVPVRVLHAIMPLAWYTAIHDHIIIAFAGPLHFLLAMIICALFFRFAEVSNTVKCIVHILFHTNG